MTGEATLTMGWLEAVPDLFKWSTEVKRRWPAGEVTGVANIDMTSALGNQDFGVRCFCHKQRCFSNPVIHNVWKQIQVCM